MISADPGWDEQHLGQSQLEMNSDWCGHNKRWTSVEADPGRDEQQFVYTQLEMNNNWGENHRLNMELDRSHWLRPPHPPPPHLGSYTGALLISQDGRHLFVTPWGEPTETAIEACWDIHKENTSWGWIREKERKRERERTGRFSHNSLLSN